MFAESHLPEMLTPDELDRYLESGWFRMGQTIFTTNFLNFNNELYSAIWLRVALDGFGNDKTFGQLKRLNAPFNVIIRPASIDQDKEILFSRYRQSVPFNASNSVNTLLFGTAKHNIFYTMEVVIYDKSRLIACGYFDLGRESAAGITCFYDPLYKRFSLGKYLMFLKLEYCREVGLKYFYPGYFVPGYKAFDYKLKIGKPAIEFLRVSDQQWLPIAEFNPARVPMRVMHDRLCQLQESLLNNGITTRLLKYEFFDANIIPDLNGMILFDFPLLLTRFNGSENSFDPVVVYDVRDGCYHMLKCASLWRSNLPDDLVEIFSSDLLKITADQFATDSSTVMAERISLVIDNSLERKQA
ncbi:MAG TPA: arginyl-tRNA--protein arginylyltransferase [Chryseosolibacter sp.]|nr:arginyl-tRNA--protein arginylyltransferase [Chryseosolibacter sp.]